MCEFKYQCIIKQINDHMLSQDRMWIVPCFGEPCTLNELLDPEEEREIGENSYLFEGGDTEIIQMVQAEIGLGSGDIGGLTQMMSPKLYLHLTRR